jgi:hypothetical protein
VRSVSHQGTIGSAVCCAEWLRLSEGVVDLLFLLMRLRLPVWRRGLPVEAQPRCKKESRSDRLGKAEPFRTLLHAYSALCHTRLSQLVTVACQSLSQ